MRATPSRIAISYVTVTSVVSVGAVVGGPVGPTGAFVTVVGTTTGAKVTGATLGGRVGASVVGAFVVGTTTGFWVGGGPVGATVGRVVGDVDGAVVTGADDIGAAVGEAATLVNRHTL
jgi:hypothetical protein